jgi:hypothetical protein
MQVFQKREDRVLGGIDEALAVLRLCSGEYDGYEQVEFAAGAPIWRDGQDGTS